ncbi:DUF5686 family protein [Flavobacterium enshiense]|uniref:DUF5686 family protein n=1 Tax=Flavobacterium enshiense TaxID=1341165 RepID=UPI00345DBB50
MFLFFCILINAQQPVSGIVVNAINKKPLAFATLHLSNGKTVIVDVDGKFVIENTTDVRSFIVSYTGFHSKTVPLQTNQKFYSVSLHEKTMELGELVVGKNPALEIINNTILYKDINNPEKRLNSFRFKTYNKLIITANPDSLSGKIDSVFIYEKIGAQLLKVDSSGFKFKKIIQKQHLYQTEKVSEFKYNQTQGMKETVLATRMAGFKQPIYEYISLKLQSFTDYDNRIQLFEGKYQNPVSYEGLEQYNYKILDTVFIGTRKAFMIHFKHKKKSRKAKLEGILYIDKQSFAIAKTVYRVKGVLDISAINHYEYYKEEDLWFPGKQSLKIVKGNKKGDLKILGETIKFTPEEELATEGNKKKEASDFVYILSESKNSETEFNIPVSIRHQYVGIEVKEEAISRNEHFWIPYRKDSLDVRSIETYSTLDSLVTKERYEQKILLGRKVINGFFPVGPIDFDLRYLIKYNNYEGFRFGVGGITNDKFSRLFRIEGYGAYGLKDDAFKYSLGGAVRLGNFSNSWVGVSYTDDIREIASTSYEVDKRKFRLYDPRPLNLTTFYSHQTWKGYIETRLIPKTESIWQLSQSHITPKFNYVFTVGDKTFTDFNITLATASVQWNPFSVYMQTPNGRIETEKRFPKFAFQFSQTLPGFFGNDIGFGKFDFRSEFEKKYLDGQKTSLLFQFGIAYGDTPITHLYSISPNSLNKDAILQRINISGKNSFETMRFNEFFSEEYIALHFKHALKRIPILKQVKPTPVLVSRFAWGTLKHNERHSGAEFNTLENGYFESGLELNNIFKGLGFSGFYRYGHYHLPSFDDNISLKLTFTLDLGL